MRKVLCLSTGEYVLPNTEYYKHKTLENAIKYHYCYRTIHGLHFYMGLKKNKATYYLSKCEIIPPYLLEIVEVPDE
jgi:hypothetical protein